MQLATNILTSSSPTFQQSVHGPRKQKDCAISTLRQHAQTSDCQIEAEIDLATGKKRLTQRCRYIRKQEVWAPTAQNSPKGFPPLFLPT